VFDLHDVFQESNLAVKRQLPVFVPVRGENENH
jgi:hypothetical protein